MDGGGNGERNPATTDASAKPGAHPNEETRRKASLHPVTCWQGAVPKWTASDGASNAVEPPTQHEQSTLAKRGKANPHPPAYPGSKPSGKPGTGMDCQANFVAKRRQNDRWMDATAAPSATFHPDGILSTTTQSPQPNDASNESGSCPRIRGPTISHHATGSDGPICLQLGCCCAGFRV